MKPFYLLLILWIILSLFPTCAEAWPNPATVVSSLGAIFVGTLVGTQYFVRQSKRDSCSRNDSSCIANDSLLNPANYIYKPLPPPPTPTPSNVCSLPVVSPFVCDAAWVELADPEPVPSNSSWFDSLLKLPQHIKFERPAVFETCREGLQWLAGSFLHLLSIIFEPALNCLRHEYGQMALQRWHCAFNLFWIYVVLLFIIEVARRLGDAMPTRMKDFFCRNSPVLRDITLGCLGVVGIAVMLAVSFTALTIGACVAFVWSWAWAGIMQGFEDLLEAFFRIKTKHKLQESDQEALLRECASHGPLIRRFEWGQESLKQEVDHVREEIVPVFYDCRTPGQPDNAIVAPSTADVVAVCNSGTSYVATALTQQQQDIWVVQRELLEVREEVNSKKDVSVGPTSTSADSVSKKDLEASQQEVKAMVKQQTSVLIDAFNDCKRAENRLKGEVELLMSAQAAVPTPSEPGVSRMDFLQYKTEVSNRFTTLSTRVPEQHNSRRIYASIDRVGRARIDELQAQIEARPSRQEFNALVSKVSVINMAQEDPPSSKPESSRRRKVRSNKNLPEPRNLDHSNTKKILNQVADGLQKTTVEDVAPVSIPETSTTDQDSTSGLPASQLPPPPADSPASQPSSVMFTISGSQALARYFSDFPDGVDMCSIQAPQQFNNGLRALNDSMDGQHSDVLDLQVPTVGNMEQLMIQPDFVAELLEKQIAVSATNMMSQSATFFVLLQRWALQTKFNRPICLGFTTPQHCEIIYNQGDLEREELLSVWLHYDSVGEKSDSDGKTPEKEPAKLQSNWLGLERRYPEDTQPAQSVNAAPPSTSPSVGAVAVPPSVPPPPSTPLTPSSPPPPPADKWTDALPPPLPASSEPAPATTATEPLLTPLPASPEPAPVTTVTGLPSSPVQPSKGSDNHPLPADTGAIPSITQPTVAPSKPDVPAFFKKPFKLSLKMSKTEKVQPQPVNDISTQAKDNGEEVNKSVVVPVSVNPKPSLQNEQTGEAETQASQSTEDKPISNEPDDGFDHSMSGTSAPEVTTADTGATGMVSVDMAPLNQEAVVPSLQLAQQQTASIPSTTSSGQDSSQVAPQPVLSVLSYAERAYALFTRQFQDGHYRTIPTPGQDLMCAFYALIESMKAQHKVDISFEELRTVYESDTIKQGLQSFQVQGGGNIGLDVLTLVVRTWRQLKDPSGTEQIHIGSVTERISGVQVVEVKDLLDSIEAGCNPVIVWVYNDNAAVLNAHSPVPVYNHWSGITQMAQPSIDGYYVAYPPGQAPFKDAHLPPDQIAPTQNDGWMNVAPKSTSWPPSMPNQHGSQIGHEQAWQQQYSQQDSQSQGLNAPGGPQSTEQNTNSSAVHQEQMEVDTDLGDHQVGFGNQPAQSQLLQPLVNRPDVEIGHDDMDFEQNQVSGVQSHPQPPPQEPQQPLQEADMQDSTLAVANTTPESRPLDILHTSKIVDTNAGALPHQSATQQTVQLPISSPSAVEAKNRFLTDLGRAELDPEIPPYRHVKGFHSVFNAIVVSMAHQYPDEMQPVLQDLYRGFMRYGVESRESHKRVALAFQDWAKQTLSKTLFLGVKYAPGSARDDMYAIFPPSLVANGTRNIESVLWITCTMSDYYSLQGCHPLCRGYDNTIEDWNWVSQVSEPNGLEPLPPIGDGLAAIIDSATRQFPPQWRKPGLTGLKAVLDHVEGKPGSSFKKLGPLIVALVFSNWFDLYSNTQTPVYLGIKDMGLKEDQCRVFVPDLVPDLYSGKGNFEIVWIYRHKEGHKYSGMGRPGGNTTTGWATFQRIEAQSSLAANMSSFRWSSIAQSQVTPTTPPPPSSEAAKQPAENAKSGRSQVQSSAAQADISGTSSPIHQGVNSGASPADQPQEQGAPRPQQQEAAAAANQADSNEEELSPFEIASRRQEEEKNKIQTLNAQLTKATEDQVKKYSAEARARFIKDFSRSQKSRPEEMTVAGSSHLDTWLNAVVLSMCHQFPDQVQPTTRSLREFVNQQGGSGRESLGMALNKWADHHIHWPVFLGVRIYDASETCTYRIHPEARFKDTDFVLWVNCDVRTTSNQSTRSTYRALRCAYDPKFEDWQLGETDERRPRDVFPDGYDLIHLGSRAEDVNNALHAVAASALWQWNDLPADDNPGPLISEAILPIWMVAQKERMLRDDCIDAEDLGYVFAVWYSIWGKRRTKWYLGVWEEEERVSKIFALCDRYDDPIVDDDDPILWIRKEKGKNIYAGMRGRGPHDWPAPRSSNGKDKSNDADDAMDEDGSDEKDPKDGQGSGAKWRKPSVRQQLSNRSAPQKQGQSASETATNYDFKNALTKPPAFDVGFAGSTLPPAYPSATTSQQLNTPAPQAYPLFSPNMHKFANNQAASSNVAFTLPSVEEKAEDRAETPSTAATTQSKPDRETENNDILDLADRKTSPPPPPSVIDDKTAQDSMRKLLEKRKLMEKAGTSSEYRDTSSDQKSDDNSDSEISWLDDDMSDADDNGDNGNDDDDGAAPPGSAPQSLPQSETHKTAPSDDVPRETSTQPEDAGSTETPMNNEQTPPASEEQATQTEPSKPAGAAFSHHMNYDDDTGLADGMNSITLDNDDEMEEFALDNDSDAEECVIDNKRKADEYDCDADDEGDGDERPQRNSSAFRRCRDIPDQSTDELDPADRERLDGIKTSLQEADAEAAREKAAREAREAAEKEELAKLEQLMDADVYHTGGQTNHVQIKGWVASETKDIVDEHGNVVATYSETPDNVPLPSTPDQEPADTRDDGDVDGSKLDGGEGEGDEAPLPPWPTEEQTSEQTPSQVLPQDGADFCILDSDDDSNDDSDFGSESHDAGADNSVGAGRSADVAEDENMVDHTSNAHASDSPSSNSPSSNSPSSNSPSSNSPSSMAAAQNHEANANTDDSVGVGGSGESGEESDPKADSNADSDSAAQTQVQPQIQARSQPQRQTPAQTQTQTQTQPEPQPSQTPSTSTSPSTSSQSPLGSVSSTKPAIPGRKILKPKVPRHRRFAGFAALGAQGTVTEFVGPANADSKAEGSLNRKGILKGNGNGKANTDEKLPIQLQQKKKRVRFEEDCDENAKGDGDGEGKAKGQEQGQLKRRKSLDEAEGDGDGDGEADQDGMAGVE